MTRFGVLKHICTHSSLTCSFVTLCIHRNIYTVYTETLVMY